MNITPTQRQNFEKLDIVHSCVVYILDLARYEMAERNQPIYGNPAYKAAQRMMGYEWDYMRPNCVDLYRKNLIKCIRAFYLAGLCTTTNALDMPLFMLNMKHPNISAKKRGVNQPN